MLPISVLFLQQGYGQTQPGYGAYDQSQYGQQQPGAPAQAGASGGAPGYGQQQYNQQNAPPGNFDLMFWCIDIIGS